MQADKIKLGMEVQIKHRGHWRDATIFDHVSILCRPTDKIFWCDVLAASGEKAFRAQCFTDDIRERPENDSCK